MVSGHCLKKILLKDKQKLTQKGQVQVKPEAVLEPCRIVTELHKLHREQSRASGNLDEWSHQNPTGDLTLNGKD
jgi:hypothetical protein